MLKNNFGKKAYYMFLVLWRIRLILISSVLYYNKPQSFSMYNRYLTLILTCCISIQIFSQSISKPDHNRFSKIVLDNDLNEPMELDIADDGIIYYIERVGHINKFDPQKNKKTRITTLKVRSTSEDGLLGLALDPQFSKNHWIYLYYGNPILQGKEFTNVLSRFELTEKGLSNKIELLHVPVISEGVSHSAGSLVFDKKGNLYLSTGDNTNPFESGGYSPSDDNIGRIKFDALKSSGNTNDLRGKILRIHPEIDGTYTIPQGNLFPQGTPGTRSEIYVMGCRNPFRISVDHRTNFLYWGEVGPDAGKDSLSRGPKGYDEINQARAAGNFGWPLFVGDNKAYNKFDFINNQSEGKYNADFPVNFSRNNTGLKNLPPAQKALIWYPYEISTEFPELGTGGRNAMAGPVYYFEENQVSEGQLPKYFDRKLLIYDWMRGWIFTTSFKPNGNFESLERFMPSEVFNHPIDMVFNSHGVLYMLEYGTYWRAKNNDAKLVRIEYNEGNRNPIAKISADKLVGAAPLIVNFSAIGSFDYDKSDSLKYEWFFTNNSKIEAKGISPHFKFNKKGIYRCKLRVTDSKGNSNEKELTIQVGNEAPKVKVVFEGNRSFYFDRSNLKYRVQIKDREDKYISFRRTNVSAHYLPEGEDLAALLKTGERYFKGKALMAQSDCYACHARNNKSVGPSLIQISNKYTSNDIDQLSQKVISGGGGIWTKTHVMSAHPQLAKEDVQEMIQYILSLRSKNNNKAGTIEFNKGKGNYILFARYTDSGGQTGQEIIRLRQARLQSSDAEEFKGVAKKNIPGGSFMSYNENSAWISYKNIDLTGLKTIKASLYSPNLVGDLEIRIGNENGRLIGRIPIKGAGNEEGISSLLPIQGAETLFFVYKEKTGGINIWKRLDLKWLEFSQ